MCTEDYYNERADLLAKQEAAKPQSHSLTSLNSIRQQIRSTINQKTNES